MKGIVGLATAAALFAGPALAGDWAYVAETPYGVLAVNLASIERTGGIAFVEHVLALRRPFAAGAGQVAVYQEQWMVHCGRGDYRLGSRSVWSPSGAWAADTDRYTPDDIHRPQPGTPQALILAIACGTAQPSQRRWTSPMAVYADSRAGR